MYNYVCISLQYIQYILFYLLISSFHCPFCYYFCINTQLGCKILTIQGKIMSGYNHFYACIQKTLLSHTIDLFEGTRGNWDI